MNIGVPKAKALRLLEAAVETMPDIGDPEQQYSSEYVTWQRDTQAALTRIIGEDVAREFSNNTSGSDVVFLQDVVIGELHSLINQIEEWVDDSVQPLSSAVPQGPDNVEDQDHALPPPDGASSLAESCDSYSNKVFLVHGHDEAGRREVAEFLKELGLEPIVLSKITGQGRTIIEKFEAHSRVGFAVVLLTPDDIGSRLDEDPQPRARQNVIFEFGYFLGKLGRKHVRALVKGDRLEIPSDYSGVEYIQFDANGGWKLTLAREMKETNPKVDMNRLADPG